MLLTIGLLINNDEKFLRDCLNGIKPILDNVPSELIVLYDNGSKDNSVAIAKNFTNNVFEIEWRNDFAWARNQHLKRAKGEWFFK
ncbi:MAG: glycosyltransferase, partial [Firmicutes bacterium]|nr:glycosyltransferase [Bacillota bacterium]